jgi:NADH-quinone oxidoreductase subunit L
MFFMAFYGENAHEIDGKTQPSIRISLAALAFLAIAGGVVNLPENFGAERWLSGLLRHSLPETSAAHHGTSETLMQMISGIVVLLGVAAAYRVYRKPAGRGLMWFRQSAVYRYMYHGWGFDRLYDRLLVAPVVWLARVDEHDVIDYINRGIARFHVWWHNWFKLMQTGRLRWYAMGIAAGAILALVILVFFN